MRSRWGAIANPHAKVFDPPPAPQVPPLGHDPGNSMKICFLSFICENTHKVWYEILKLSW